MTQERKYTLLLAATIPTKPICTADMRGELSVPRDIEPALRAAEKWGTETSRGETRGCKWN